MAQGEGYSVCVCALYFPADGKRKTSLLAEQNEKSIKKLTFLILFAFICNKNLVKCAFFALHNASQESECACVCCCVCSPVCVCVCVLHTPV